MSPRPNSYQDEIKALEDELIEAKMEIKRFKKDISSALDTFGVTFDVPVLIKELRHIVG